MSIEEKIDQMFDDLFHFAIGKSDDLYDLVIEYKDTYTGKTIRRSWKERNERLTEKQKTDDALA